MPSVPFCRYADDGILHCRSQKQAEFVMASITSRFRSCGLEIHPEKSKIVYCKDSNRKKTWEHISFDFLGYTFRPRRCVNPSKGVHPNFLPAISRTSKKAIHREIRSWHIQLKNEKSLEDLSRMFNPILRGWLQYYGRFYPSAMRRIWVTFNRYLVRWLQRKSKYYARHWTKARQYVDRFARTHKKCFVHWELGVFPMPSSSRSRMS